MHVFKNVRSMKNYFFTISTLVLSLFSSSTLLAQSYTNYHTGDTVDWVTTGAGGLCLMGGATEHDEAMKWFLQRANGGDVLVLRASGSDGYNNYLYSSLGITVNSVETIVFNNALAANETYIHNKIKKAEAIWLAGGDQWDYISYWRGTAIDSLINEGIQQRGLVIGGTSAGMAVQGGFYFSAQNGTVTSNTALNNPYDMNVTVDSQAFFDNAWLVDVITDTHYDNPDRKGRHLVFLARILTDYGLTAKGIACDEYTAVCVDTNGVAAVYGDYPSYDDNAYFIQSNCALSNPNPETCAAANPLDWDRGGAALKVYAVKGTNNGTNTFDLGDWETGSGGNWEHWSVNNGSLVIQAGTAPNCHPLPIVKITTNVAVDLSPNPVQQQLQLLAANPIQKVHFYNALGQVVLSRTNTAGNNLILDCSELVSGVYSVWVETTKGYSVQKVLVQ